MATAELRFLDPDGTSPPAGTSIRDITGGTNQHELFTRDFVEGVDEKAGEWVYDGQQVNNVRCSQQYDVLLLSGDVEVLQRSAFNNYSTIGNVAAGFLGAAGAEGYTLEYVNSSEHWVVRWYNSAGLQFGTIGTPIYVGLVPPIGEFVHARFRATGLPSSPTFSAKIWLDKDPEPDDYEFIGVHGSPVTLTHFGIEGPFRFNDGRPMYVDWVSFGTDGDEAPIVTAGPRIDEVRLAAPFDRGLPPGTEIDIASADGGTRWCGIYSEGATPSHSDIKNGIGAVGVPAVDVGGVTGDPATSVVTNAITGLVNSTDYVFAVTAEDSTGAQADPVYEPFVTAQPALSFVLAMVDIQTGAPWPEGRLIEVDAWPAESWRPTEGSFKSFATTQEDGVLVVEALVEAGQAAVMVLREPNGEDPSTNDYWTVDVPVAVETLLGPNDELLYVRVGDGWVPADEWLDG